MVLASRQNDSFLSARHPVISDRSHGRATASLVDLTDGPHLSSVARSTLRGESVRDAVPGKRALRRFHVVSAASRTYVHAVPQAIGPSHVSADSVSMTPLLPGLGMRDGVYASATFEDGGH